MMRTVTAFEAKTRFGKLLERVGRGEEVVITKHDKPVARIVPEGRGNLAAMRQAASELRELRSRIAKRTCGQPKLTFEDFKAARDSGRK
jgi:prevent-host-death family protein